MKHKKIVALTLVLTLLIGVFAMVPSVGAVSDNPVKLIYAKTGYNEDGTCATGYIEVENIAYDKKVTIHYSFDGEKWCDCAAEYYKPTNGNYEAWKFETQGTTSGLRVPVTVRFAIKYEVNGQTYWDNNNGKNYLVVSNYYATHTYAFGVGGIANDLAYRYDNGIYGTLELKNLGYGKVVKVIYTTNNWATSNEVNAEYNTTCVYNTDIEVWKYTIPTTASNIQYKLSYTVNGTTYIDDNFGEYYTV